MSREQDEKGFLNRWSKRKLENDTGTSSDRLRSEDAASFVDTAENSSETASEAQSESALPIWQREDVDAETRKAALRSLFRKPEFNIRDGLNEYDDDFSHFAGLGDIVTQDMKRMLKLAEEKTRPSQTAEKESATETDQQQDNDKDNQEDKDLA